MECQYRMDNRVFQNSEGKYLDKNLQPMVDGKRRYKKHTTTRYINVHLGSNGIAMYNNGEKLIEVNKRLPELYKSKEECCGCSACYAICPLSGRNNGKALIFSDVIYKGSKNVWDLTGAITMLPDEEGFLYPTIDAARCIRCYKCINVCGFKKY